MRLRAGLILATIAVVLVLFALPATWYHVHVVGPNFMAIGVNEPMDDDVEIRELNGEWNLRNYRVTNETWDMPPEQYEDPMTVVPMYGDGDEGTPVPNANVLEVYESTTVAVGAAVVVLGLGAFGLWNIARYDRYRWFTAASFFLGAVLLLGACAHFGTQMPGALAEDATTGHEDTFSLSFDPYIDPDGGEAGYYSEFSGGYPNNDPRNAEQLSYGPGAGWWLAGAGGVLALITAAVVVGAPQWRSLKRDATTPVEVVRYVPVPTVVSLRQRRRYPKKMPPVAGNSPGNPPRRVR